MHEYNGSTVAIETWKRGPKWDWAYRINGGPRRTNSDALAPTSAVAEDEALNEARRDINAAKRNTTD